jgi:hypothetical protein
MPERPVKRRLQDSGDAALASVDGPIFSTVAKLVEALKRSIPEGTHNAERKTEALRLARELLPRDEVRRDVKKPSRPNPREPGKCPPRYRVSTALMTISTGVKGKPKWSWSPSSDACQ